MPFHCYQENYLGTGQFLHCRGIAKSDYLYVGTVGENRTGRPIVSFRDVRIDIWTVVRNKKEFVFGRFRPPMFHATIYGLLQPSSEACLQPLMH